MGRGAVVGKRVGQRRVEQEQGVVGDEGVGEGVWVYWGRH